MAWFRNCVQVDDETFAGPTKYLYDRYREWGEGRGYYPVAIGRFRNELSRILAPWKDGTAEDGYRVIYTTGVLEQSYPREVRKKGWKGFRLLPSLDDGREDITEGWADDGPAAECEHEWQRTVVADRRDDAPYDPDGKWVRVECSKCGKFRGYGARGDQQQLVLVAADDAGSGEVPF